MNLLQTREEPRRVRVGALVLVGLLVWLGFAMFPDVRRYLRIHNM